MILTITEEGVSAAVKGSKKHIWATWAGVISNAMATPMDVPSYMAGKPVEFLMYCANKRKK